MTHPFTPLSTPDQQDWNGTAFPVIWSTDAVSTTPLTDHVRTHKADIDRELARSGAVLFRGYNIDTPEKFDAVVNNYGEPGFTYEQSLSNAVRVNLTPRVFTANEAPPDISIFLHHEMAQTPLYPSKLFFACMIAPETGGATPICRSDIVLERLTAARPDLVAAFEAKGVKYTNTMPGMDDPASGQGRSWRNTLGVDTQAAAEARLAELGYSWNWVDDGSLRSTSPTLSAIRTLDDGTKVFFNQLIAAFRGWKDKRNDPSKSVSFGDGSAINPEHLAVAITLADELTYDLAWHAGDVVLIDNFRVMHGRRPFTGKRRVLAALVA